MPSWQSRAWFLLIARRYCQYPAQPLENGQMVLDGVETSINSDLRENVTASVFSLSFLVAVVVVVVVNMPTDTNQRCLMAGEVNPTCSRVYTTCTVFLSDVTYVRNVHLVISRLPLRQKLERVDLRVFHPRLINYDEVCGATFHMSLPHRARFLQSIAICVRQGQNGGTFCINLLAFV